MDNKKEQMSKSKVAAAPTKKFEPGKSQTKQIIKPKSEGIEIKKTNVRQPGKIATNVAVKKADVAETKKADVRQTAKSITNVSVKRTEVTETKKADVRQPTKSTTNVPVKNTDVTKKEQEIKGGVIGFFGG